MFPLYRNQLVDLLCKSTDWFLTLVVKGLNNASSLSSIILWHFLWIQVFLLKPKIRLNAITEMMRQRLHTIYLSTEFIVNIVTTSALTHISVTYAECYSSFLVFLECFIFPSKFYGKVLVKVGWQSCFSWKWPVLTAKYNTRQKIIHNSVKIYTYFCQNRVLKEQFLEVLATVAL